MLGVLRLGRASIVAVGLCLALASTASASRTVVDTRDDATTTFIASFGNPNTATYGQLITATDAAPVLNGFTFRVEELESDVVFRGEVFAWDATTSKAVGSPLFEGKPLTTSGVGLQEIEVDTGAIPLTPGSQYVLFLTTSQDFEAGGGNVGKFRTVKDEVYPGGQFVYLNNGTNEKQLTESTWSKSPAVDLQFRASFASAQQTLKVTKSGNGSGTVTSAGGGINCGGDCSEGFPFKVSVALQATPAPGSIFAGFSGAGCSSSPCLLSLADDATVSAVFLDVEAPQTMIVKRRGSKIRFGSSELGSTFTCTLDKKKARSCASPYKLPNSLASGKHVFKVFATDAAGNADRTPAKLKFTIG
ncbi:MAG TPA: hypothetical protein VEW07_04090 [Solirubrobacterales bacterium]|nr:hypothetical protein [Solirubrobacterales bacterium]